VKATCEISQRFGYLLQINKIQSKVLLFVFHDTKTKNIVRSPAESPSNQLDQRANKNE